MLQILGEQTRASHRRHQRGTEASEPTGRRGSSHGVGCFRPPAEVPPLPGEGGPRGFHRARGAAAAHRFFFFFSQKPLFSRTLGVFRERIASEFTCLSDSGPPLPGREGAHPLQGLLLPHLRLARPCRLTPLRPRLQDRRPKPSRAGPSLCGRMGPSASHQSLGGVLASPSPSRGSCRRQARWLCRRGLSGPLQSSSPVAVVATRKSGRVFPMQSTCVHPSKVCTLVSGLSFFFSFFWCF